MAVHSSFAPFDPLHHGTVDPSLRVRPAGESDLPAMVAIATCHGPLGPGFGDRLAGRIRETEAYVALAELDCAVVGWSGVWQWDAGDGSRWCIGGLAVAPDVRRRGAGAALLAACAEWTESNDPGAPLWSLCNARNRASLGLHARVGFREVARAPQFGSVTFEGGVGVLLRRAAAGRVTPGQ